MFEIFNNPEFFISTTHFREIPRCPRCNTSYAEFKNTGKLGCMECYKTFEKPLSDILRQVHRNPVHSGKIPGNLKAELTKKQKLITLKKQLQVAVKEEKYEEAAKIHKEILTLEKE